MDNERISRAVVMNRTGSDPVKVRKCVSQHLTKEKYGTLTICSTSPIVTTQIVTRIAGALKTAFQVDANLAAHLEISNWQKQSANTSKYLFMQIYPQFVPLTW